MLRDLLRDAVIRRLEIIGEAAKRLSLQLRSFNSDVPWKQICGLRLERRRKRFAVRSESVWQGFSVTAAPGLSLEGPQGVR
jgi:uncharacterized protein with HEPN domain